MSGADDPTVPAGQEADDPGVPLRLRPIDRYAPEARLGEGGMGVVWEAHDRVLDRKVALKVLHDRFLGDDHQVRLAAEARAMARLSHPNVVAVYDAGERDGRAFVAMELVRGRSVAAWAAGAPPWREVVAVFRAAGAGIAAAHAAGIVHRDLKPSNILLGDDGRVRVADFGVAGVAAPAAGDVVAGDTTVPAGIAGTPVYMAPERLRGEPATALGDQFSFGVALHEVLHGQRPFAGDSVEGLAEAMVAGPPPPRRPVPRWLTAVVARTLAVEPARRFPSMTAVLAALAPPRRRAPAVIAGAVAVAAGVAVVGWRSGHDDGVTSPPVATPGPADAATAPPARVNVDARRQPTRFDACAEEPMFVDDGAVVFTLTREGSRELHRVGLDGTAAGVLTSPSTWACCAASGRRPGEVLYLETPAGGDHARSQVVFVDAATAVEQDRLTVAARSAGWWNDTLYYSNVTAEVRRRRDGHDERWFATSQSGAELIVGPAGQALIEESPPGTKPRLCVAAADATTTTCLADRVPNGRPAWTPRGDAIYYPTAGGLNRVELASNQVEKTAGINAGGGVAVAPDGAHVVWSECSGRSQIVDLTAWPPRPLVKREGVRDPAVGPGGRLAWVQYTRGAPALVVQQPDGSTIELADPSLGLIASPAFSPDGVYVAFRVTGKAAGLYVTWSVGGRPLARITDDPRDQLPTWTRDGRIVFERRDDHGMPSVHVVAREGGASRQAIDAPRALVAGNLASGEILLGTVSGVVWWDPETGRERPGPDAAGDVQLAGAAISPDGRWMVEQVGDGGMELRRVRLDGDQRQEPLFTVPASAGPGKVVIDDSGRVISALVTRRGELFVAPLREP